MTRFELDEIVTATKSLDDKNGTFFLKGKQYRVCAVYTKSTWHRPIYRLIDTNLSRQYQNYKTPWIEEDKLISAIQDIQNQEGTTP